MRWGALAPLTPEHSGFGPGRLKDRLGRAAVGSALAWSPLHLD